MACRLVVIDPLDSYTRVLRFRNTEEKTIKADILFANYLRQFIIILLRKYKRTNKKERTLFFS